MEPDTDDIPQDVRDALDAAWDASPEQRRRIDQLFYQKLALQFPDHPWIKRRRDEQRIEARAAAVGVSVQVMRYLEGLERRIHELEQRLHEQPDHK